MWEHRTTRPDLLGPPVTPNHHLDLQEYSKSAPESDFGPMGDGCLLRAPD